MRKRATAIVAAALFGACSSTPSLAVFQAKRLVTGLNQPTYALQAPGDLQNLYIVQRSGTNNTVGDIISYNFSTNTTSPFLNIGGSLVQDGGLLGMAFHPGYETNGLFYVSALVGSTNKLFEYKTPSTGGTPALQRTLLSYDNPRTQHTIDWIGFKPGATSSEENYLYVTTGDGGIQANEASFTNRGQDTSLVFGKVLRLDVNPLAADAYPADANKNFAIPSTNPFVGSNTGALGEVFATGLRNPWRASFDRETGDLYIGDVGFNSKEEVSFLKNDDGFASGKDFGWARREGTVPNPVVSHAGPQGSSLNPIYQVDHATNFSSVTGGYVYRGPIPELQGKYLFADFVSSKIFALAFDRDTDPETFDGSSAGVIEVQDITAQINALINLNGGGGPVRYLVSFGEDHAGNLYLVSFGSAFFPPLGTGSIYTLNAVDTPTWNVATGGDWNGAANWSTNTVPNGFTHSATLAGPAGSGMRDVSLNTTTSLLRLTFDNSSVSYHVTGSEMLTLTANSVADAVIVAAGHHEISVPVTLQKTTRFNIAPASSLTITSPITAVSRDIIKRGEGTLTITATTANRISVTAGQLRVTGDGNFVLKAVDIGDGASLDLLASTLILDYAVADGALAKIESAIADGRLYSSTITGAIGVFDTALDPIGSFNGTNNLDATTLIIRATIRGDTNVDRAVNFDDLLALAQHYGETAKGWQQGDSDYDHDVDFDDLLALAQNYGNAVPITDLGDVVGASFAADWMLAQSLVPEPAVFAALAAIAPSWQRRRRHK